MSTYFFIPEEPTPTCAPLGLTQSLRDFPLVLKPLREHQVQALQQAGYTAATKAAKAEISIHPFAWLEVADLENFRQHPTANVLVDSAGHELLRKLNGASENLIANQSFRILYPWHLLQAHERAMALHQNFAEAPPLPPGVYCKGRVQFGKGTVFLPGVVMEGDIVIGENCKIGPNCYLRGSTSIGNQCHVGNAVEIKNSILLDNTNVGHLSYIGDSILGNKVNLGAGTITSNLRHDGKTHTSMVEGELVNTQRRKFGAIFGDGVHTGIHTSVYPGRKLWPHTTTRPGAIVQKDLTPTL